jgi:hypothetical protein
LAENLWDQKVTVGEEAKRVWSHEFEVAKINRYFEGKQWKNPQTPAPIEHPYVLNLVQSTIRIKLASLCFHNPKFILTPEPGMSNWNLDSAVKTAQLKQDALNSQIGIKRLRFAKQLKRCCQDSFFQFGIMEVGHASDYRNPLALAPYGSEVDGYGEPEAGKLVKPEPLTITESLYFKRVNPSRFITCVTDEQDLEDIEWYGYCDYYYTSQLEQVDGIDKAKIREDSYSGSVSGARAVSSLDLTEQLRALLREGQITKVYHVFDNVAKQRRLLNSCGDELWAEPFERGLLDLRWMFRQEGFYPIPPVYSWLSPQDEINESRQQMRSYRRRFTNKYQVLKNKVDPEEIDKFTAGGEGTVVVVKEIDALRGITNPNQTQQTTEDFVVSKDDFNQMSGTSAEARGVADQQTATQSKIIAMRANIIESSELLDFGIFAADCGRYALLTMIEKFEAPIWVKLTVDPQVQSQVSPPVPEEQVMQSTYQQIFASQLIDGHDFAIRLDVTDSTPAALAQDQQAFQLFNSLLVQFPHLAMDGDLIRETAFKSGYRNEKVIEKMQGAILAQQQVQQMLAEQQKAEQAAGGAPANGNPQSRQGQQNTSNGENPANRARAIAGQLATPGEQQITNQLTNQVQ